jgi:hypothetical protein
MMKLFRSVRSFGVEPKSKPRRWPLHQSSN